MESYPYKQNSKPNALTKNQEFSHRDKDGVNSAMQEGF